VIIIDADTSLHTQSKGSSLKGGFSNRKAFLDVTIRQTPS
jgi:hypothetical protein